MAERTPMVKVDGYWRELPAGDTVAGASGSSGWTITAKTADYTVLAGDSGTAFTNIGSGGNVTFTLPASAGCTAGQTVFRFVAMEAQYIYIDPDGSDTLLLFSEGLNNTFTASSGTPAHPSSNLGGEYIDVLYMGGGLWHGICSGRWRT